METVVDIDEEFASLGTSLNPEELSLLEANIDEHGCLDSLKVWTEKGVLLDGHNRYRICKQLGKDFSVEHLSFKNREAAIEWVIDFQLGRRNASEEQKAYYRGKRYRHEKKKKPNEAGHNQHSEVKSQSGPQPATAEKLGKEYGVSKNTIKRDAKFSAEVDAIAEVSPEAKATILSGKSPATRKQVAEVAALPKEERKAAAQSLVEKPARRERDKDASPKTKTDIDTLVERIEKVMEYVNTLVARHAMQHNDKSTALVEHLKKAVPMAKAMGRSWRNE